MTSPETPPPAPPRSAFVVGDGTWKAITPFAVVLSIFLAFLGGMLIWFDSRFADGIDGVESRLTAQIVEVKTDLSNRIDEVKADLLGRIDEVKADLRATESRLTARIDRVEKELGSRIDRVEGDLGTRIDEVKAELAAGEARRAAIEERLSSGIGRNAAGVAENRAAHRELAGFVRAGRSQEPASAATGQDPAPAQ